MKKMNGKKYFLRIANLYKDRNAGFKAVRDCEEILTQCGYRAYNIVVRKFSSALLNRLMSLEIRLRLHFLPRHSSVVVAHPIYDIEGSYIDWLREAKEKRGLTLIFLIHDLPSLRQAAEKDAALIRRDREMYAIADKIIVHNGHMKAYLEENGVDPQKLVCLGIFDYLSGEEERKAAEPAMVQRAEAQRNGNASWMNVAIAGNLNADKVGYLRFLGDVPEVDFHLYGGGFMDRGQKNVHYHGSFAPEELPEKLEGAFGLVWDGDSPEGCQGGFGQYIRYNNPHKTSLYLAAGLPVITWRAAAIADFIIENRAGIVVDRLSDIGAEIRKLSAEDYAALRQNAVRLSQRIHSGAYLREAMERTD